MATKNENDEITKVDYFMDVILRNYCRASEELDVVYEELNSMQEVLTILFKENADLRFRLNEAGIEVEPSDFVSAEELAEIEGLETI